MIEAFVLSIIMCSPNAIEFGDCQSLISRNAYDNERDCVIELMDEALPWVTSQGLVVAHYSCGPYTLPFSLDEPA
jgi:hypothetical protein